MVLPAIEAIRKQGQPAMNKALLKEMSIIPSPNVRLPLMGPSSLLTLETKTKLESLLGRLGP